MEDVAIGIDAAVAQEGPPAAYLFGVTQVDVDDYALLLVFGGLVDDLSLRACDERCAPELDPSGLTAGIQHSRAALAYP